MKELLPSTAKYIQNYGEQHEMFHSPQMKAWRKQQKVKNK